MGLLHVYVLRSVYHCLWWCGFALVVLWLILGVVLFVISRIYSAVVHDFSIRCGCISAFRVLCIVIWLIFTVDWKNLLIQRRCYWCISGVDVAIGCVLLNKIDWYDTIDWKKSLDMASVSCVLTYEIEWNKD